MSNKKNDLLLAAAIPIVIFFLCLFGADNNCYWGDDFAAYMSEGIAIADGYFDEQTSLNYIMHPTALPDEANGGKLVYTWGYSLLLAAVYKIAGFDRVGFTSLIYYKIPSVLAVALFSGILYLFLRRRFGRRISFVFAFLFGTCYNFRYFINTLYSDIVFLFFAMLSLYLAELFLDSVKKRDTVLFGTLLGLSLWFTYEVRLNGISILFACAAACIIRAVSERKQADRHRVLTCLFPFIVFLLLKLVSEAILAPATGNTSDISNVTLRSIIANLKTYYESTCSFLGQILDDAGLNLVNSILSSLTSTGEDTYGVIADMCSTTKHVLSIIILIICLIGLISDGFRRKNLHLTLFAFVYIFVVCMLPYNQGTRYILPVLVLLPMYNCYGLLCLSKVMSDKITASAAYKVICSSVAAFLCIITLLGAVKSDIYYRKADNTEDQALYYWAYAYTDKAIDVYNYISDNLPADCSIAFYKPRALYLNTERLSFRPDKNGHSLEDAGYYLVAASMEEQQLPVPDSYELIYTNSEFSLYENMG